MPFTLPYSPTLNPEEPLIQLTTLHGGAAAVSRLQPCPECEDWEAAQIFLQPSQKDEFLILVCWALGWPQIGQRAFVDPLSWSAFSKRRFCMEAAERFGIL